VLGLTEGGQIGLELTHLRAHDPGAADDGLLHGGLDLSGEAEALGLKVDEGDGHERKSPVARGEAAGVQRRCGCGLLPNRPPPSQTPRRPRGVTSRDGLQRPRAAAYANRP
jgi:hypothetical protein